ncbi:hypothetical protein [Candidatus Enterococcus clewellii]|uniref:Uncharacterized protein n=1 Tax=Candidatus Enterococcus clewellii TaxID=1834193 RepID=A0A242KDX0_9ENTE|nr:hypothetical protein [Enterococcus sp. 9E7_DIV0242]OTP18740.1 hypothetical protein A5888_000554 [Enterococcus sp. 9E7_DIV0242]
MTLKFQNNLNYDVNEIKIESKQAAVAALAALDQFTAKYEVRLEELRTELADAEEIQVNSLDKVTNLEEISAMVNFKKDTRKPATIKEEIQLIKDLRKNESVPLFEAAHMAIYRLYNDCVSYFEPYKEHVSLITWEATYTVVGHLNIEVDQLSAQYEKYAGDCCFYEGAEHRKAPDGNFIRRVNFARIRMTKPTAGEKAEFNHLLFQ